MANSIRIKRRAAGGAAGAPSTLANAELAFNEQDSTLYYGLGTGGAGGTATSALAIAGPGAVVTLNGAQTITGAKTFSAANDMGAATVASTQATGDSSTKLATTAFVKAQLYLTGNQAITASGDATGTGTTAIALTLANSGVTAGTWPKVTVDAKGRVTVGALLLATDVPTLTAAKVSDFDTQVRTSRLDQLAAPAAAVALNSQRITGLADPTSAQDAATKNYVDSISAGLDPKASCRAATTANITLSGTQTIDGIAVIAGDRVLVKNQTTGSQNGIYNVSAGAWTRSTDADLSSEVTSGMFTFIEEGATAASSGWVLATVSPITLATTALVFVQFSGAGQITAGTGLTKSGNTLSINTGYTGQSSITTLGTVTTGVWNGTAIAVANGGTGASDTGNARANLGLGSMATQNNSAVAISGGYIDATPIGQTYQAAGAFTTVAATGSISTINGNISSASGSISANQNITAGNNLVCQNGTVITGPTFAGWASLKITNSTTNKAAPAAGDTELVNNVLYFTPNTTRQRVAVTDGILAIAAGKTFTASNTLTLTGTDASTLNIGAGGTLGSAAYTASTAYATSAQGTKADNVGAVSGIVKSNGSASFSAAVAGTDFLSPSSDIDGGTF